MNAKPKTRWSLVYLAGYLLLGGAGLLIAPRLALQMLFATGDYGTLMPRLAGALMVVLGILVVQIVREEIFVLYGTTLFARALLLGCIVLLYMDSGDPVFLALLAIVGFGFVLTGSLYVLEHRSQAAANTATARR